MSNHKSTKKSGGSVAGAVVAAAVTTVTPFVKPAIDIIIDHINKKIEEREKLIAVPELYSEQFPLTVEQAVERLKSRGLTATLVKSSIGDAHPKYRKCFNSQVILSKPRAKQKVKPGSDVMVKYITQEVIEESQRIFEETEKQKLQIESEKAFKRSEQKEKVKQAASNGIETVKRSVEKIPTAFRGKNDKK